MKKVSAYLIFILTLYAIALWALIQKKIIMPETVQLVLMCSISGGIGGVLYCLRGIYLNASVFQRWSEVWYPWYFLRPLTSFICGAASFLFLKAGLIMLEARQIESPSNLAFYAFAFAAGLNVDKFVEKIEDIAQVTWGIKKSRTANKDSKNAGSEDSLS
ncbi:MAG TPA: hypothetical protein DCL35_06950 [Candidatus Omnitrophica bacterium]|nr:hypothetical protein [Candidatus Omnitrophota bacterium]